MDRKEVIDIIYQALMDRKLRDDRLFDAEYDGPRLRFRHHHDAEYDNDSASVIITTEDGGKHQEWIISSEGVRLLEDDVEDDEEKELHKYKVRVKDNDPVSKHIGHVSEHEVMAYSEEDALDKLEEIVPWDEVLDVSRID